MRDKLRSRRLVCLAVGGVPCCREVFGQWPIGESQQRHHDPLEYYSMPFLLRSRFPTKTVLQVRLYDQPLELASAQLGALVR